VSMRVRIWKRLPVATELLKLTGNASHNSVGERRP
jgi:hypothetical protein